MSSERYLHIVCSDIPFPLDTGSAFDVYYAIHSLSREGIKIILHCFDDGRGPQAELSRLCEEVFYYPRNQGHKGFSFNVPYIVGSRISEKLADNLAKDDHPVLVEGVQCTAFLRDMRLRNRKVFLREARVDSLYYKKLVESTWNPFRKFYFNHQGSLLSEYERRVFQRLPVCCSSEKDKKYLQRVKALEVLHIPAFLPFQEVKSLTGIGSYCLYHGNLGEIENERVAFFLLRRVFNSLKIPFVIAGSHPSPALRSLAKRSNFHCLVENPTEPEMQDMISKAQINILPTFRNTGSSMKLLNALFNGRHCLVNELMVEGTGLEPATHIASTVRAFKSILLQLYHQPFPEEEILLRKQLLEKTFNNKQNAKRLIQWIW